MIFTLENTFQTGTLPSLYLCRHATIWHDGWR